MNRLDLLGPVCPASSVDRQLWRNAQAERADAVARLPWHDIVTARNHTARLLTPALTRRERGRNRRVFGPR